MIRYAATLLLGLALLSVSLSATDIPKNWGKNVVFAKLDSSTTFDEEHLLQVLFYAMEDLQLTDRECPKVIVLIDDEQRTIANLSGTKEEGQISLPPEDAKTKVFEVWIEPHASDLIVGSAVLSVIVPTFKLDLESATNAVRHALARAGSGTVNVNALKEKK